MSKEFIYFFKHKRVAGVKIGRTSGDSVNQRFACFKTYSPFGAEILGFFECDNCVQKEIELHRRFSALRMHGEFFNISEDIVKSIVIQNQCGVTAKINLTINEWISNPENDIHKLNALLKSINKIDSKPDMSEDQLLVLSKYKPGTSNDYDTFLTVKGMCETLNIEYKKMHSSRIFTSIGFIVSVKRFGNETLKGFFCKSV